MTQRSEPNPPPAGRSSQWLVRGGLASLALVFLAYASRAVPRLTNSLVGDSEFTGWTGPIAERFFDGSTPYQDFLLPIPPGPFVVMAAVQALGGPPRLLQELWLVAVCHLGMAGLAYVIARAFSGPLTSLLVSGATLATVIQLYKECAYDHTAQLLAWGSIAAGAHALAKAKPCSRLWLLSGALAAVTLAFKQSTGSGIALGWICAFAYLGGLALLSRDAGALRNMKRILPRFVAGAAVGVGIDLVLLLATQSSISGFIASAYVDGAALKGGSLKLAFNLFSYLWRFPAWPASLGLTLVVALLVRRAYQASGDFDLSRRDETDSPRLSLLSVLVLLGGFGAATALLWSDAAPPSASVLAWSQRAKMIPAFGLCALVVFAATRTRLPAQDAEGRAAAERGHALLAVCIAALTCSLLHNLSFPGFRPFYDNNPIIVIAYLLMFAALDRARLGWAKPMALALGLSVLFGHKLSRHLEATSHVEDGHWAGTRVSARGRVVVQAARRAQELAGEAGTVLVLPEDVTLARLIARPRPALRGAIVFVDQYPARALAPDLSTLEASPPTVVVIHPADPSLWRRMYALWSTNSPAQQLADKFLADWLPKKYRLDSSYPTRFGHKRGELQVWVLRN